MAMIAPMPAVAARRRASRPDFMFESYLYREVNYIVQKSASSMRKSHDTAWIVGICFGSLQTMKSNYAGSSRGLP
jgi:hypothetical protein